MYLYLLQWKHQKVDQVQMLTLQQISLKKKKKKDSLKVFMENSHLLAVIKIEWQSSFFLFLLPFAS